MNENVTVISDSNGKVITLTNRLSDPSAYIVEVYKKFLFFKKRISSVWFNDYKQALEFAKGL